MQLNIQPKTEKKLTVIIPTFNRHKFLERAINSVLAQSLQDFELIIIDDGSTDLSYRLKNKYKNQLIYLKQPNKGVSAARNLGIKIANSEYIAFLDSDDVWHSDKLAKQIDYLRINSHLLLCHSDEIWLRDKQPLKQLSKHKKSGGDIFYDSLNLCLISPSTVILRKEAFYRYGLFREDLPACEDYDLWLRITAFNQVGFIAEKLITRHGGHLDQLSKKYQIMDKYRIIALASIIENPALSSDKKQAAIKVMHKKLNILKKGAIKRDNQEISNFADYYLRKLKQ